MLHHKTGTTPAKAGVQFGNGKLADAARIYIDLPNWAPASAGVEDRAATPDVRDRSSFPRDLVDDHARGDAIAAAGVRPRLDPGCELGRDRAAGETRPDRSAPAIQARAAAIIAHETVLDPAVLS